MTRDGFNFVPKPIPVRLTSTHGSLVGIKQTTKLTHTCIHVLTIQHENNNLHVCLHNLKHMHSTLL
jgi:hypothetical protein